MSFHILIVGTSTRAAAASAARAGLRVTAIDDFADRDHHPAVHALSVVHDFGMRSTAAALARAARTIECDAVAYLSPFENHARAVSALSAGRILLGNSPDVLRRVRDPRTVAAALRDRGLAAPAVQMAEGDIEPAPDTRGVRLKPDSTQAGPALPDWLVKPLRSGGGRRVRPWRASQGSTNPLARRAIWRRCYVQQRIAGTPGSVVFAAARGNAVPLGVSRQLVGDPAFGARGFRYCGSIMAAPDDPQFAHGGSLVAAAADLARVMAAEFQLTGVNGVDFIARDGVPYAIEVNPRWSSSMELVEERFGLSVFGAHLDACRSGSLPDLDFASAPARTHAVGKAVVFAQRDVVAGDTDAWLDQPWMRDVPRSGEHFNTGSPICTVLAEGRDADECYRSLVARAAAVKAMLATS